MHASPEICPPSPWLTPRRKAALDRRRSQERAARNGSIHRIRQDRKRALWGGVLVELVASGDAYPYAMPELDVEAHQLDHDADVVMVVRYVLAATLGFKRPCLVASHADFARLLRCSRRKAGDVVRRAVELGFLEVNYWTVRREDRAELDDQELLDPDKRPRGLEATPHYRQGVKLRCLITVRENARFRRAVDEKSAAPSYVGSSCQPSSKEPDRRIKESLSRPGYPQTEKLPKGRADEPDDDFLVARPGAALALLKLPADPGHRAHRTAVLVDLGVRPRGTDDFDAFDPKWFAKAPWNRGDA